LLAWWRTGIGVAAVALAIGGLLPKLSHVPRERFEALGVGYALLAVAFVVGGTIRDRAAQKAIDQGSFAALPTWAVATLTVYLAALIVLSIVAFY